MQTIGAFEAKTHFSALLSQVEKGEEVIITKHGHPIAKIVPAKAINKVQKKIVIARLKEFCKNNKLAGLDWKELRDAGRR